VVVVGGWVGEWVGLQGGGGGGVVVIVMIVVVGARRDKKDAVCECKMK
jgi:hypothetical protein